MSIKGHTEKIRQRRKISFVQRVALALVLICGFLGCAALSIAGVADEFEEVEWPQPLVKTTVIIDPRPLPSNPRIEDWYQVAVLALEESGWDLSPNLTSILVTNFGCSADPVLDQLTMHFADTYFDGVVPSIKFASVTIDRASKTASVEISYQLLRWQYSPMRISEIRVGYYEALQVAARNGGQEFRYSTNDRCEISPFLSDYEWHIGYFKTDGRSSWPDLRVVVNAKSGEAKQLRD